MIDYHWVRRKFEEFVEQHRYLEDHPNSYIITPNNKDATYRHSIAYLLDNSSPFHTSHLVKAYLNEYIESMEKNPSTVLDVGCATGITGLRFLEHGHHVTFYDFDGIGIQFLKWLIRDQEYDDAIACAYGNSLPVEKFDIVVAFDVLEHTGNHLGFLHWISQLGRKVVISFPHITKFYPPYVPKIDEWVDTEIICYAIKKRFQNVDFLKQDGRMFARFDVEN